MSQVLPQFAPNPPGTVNAFLNGPAALWGAPVCVAIGHSGGMLMSLANAASLLTANCVGLLVAPSQGGDTACGFLPIGPLTLDTPEQWDAITGQTGGLTPGDWYYVSDAVAGQLTNVAPDTDDHYVVPVGHALSTTTMVITRSIPVEVT